MLDNILSWNGIGAVFSWLTRLFYLFEWFTHVFTYLAIIFTLLVNIYQSYCVNVLWKNH